MDRIRKSRYQQTKTRKARALFLCSGLASTFLWNSTVFQTKFYLPDMKLDS